MALSVPAIFWSTAVGRIAGAGAVALSVIAQISGEAGAIAIGLAFFMLGFAHGAADEENGTIAPFGWASAAAYIMVGFAVVGLFLTLPLAGLALFLALSAWHFYHSDGGAGSAARLAISLLAIGGSALYRDDLANVFGSILGYAPPPVFLGALVLSGVVGTAATLLALLRREQGALLALLAVMATMLLHPVLAVGLIFLTGHALPMQVRQIEEHGSRTVMGAALWTCALATIGAVALIALVIAGVVAIPVAAALALGMATPHMLTERLAPL